MKTNRIQPNAQRLGGDLLILSLLAASIAVLPISSLFQLFSAFESQWLNFLSGFSVIGAHPAHF